MAHITREEVLKIAKMSHIELHDDEIEPLIKKLHDVLTYAERVKDIAARGATAPLYKASNVWREDGTVPSDADRVLAQAPEEQEHYFVVPRILESNQ